MTAGGNPVVVGQLGCGYWGPNLIRNLVADSRCHLAAVADPDPSRRSYIEGTFPQVQVQDDPRKLLSDPEIDAVVIATPAATHEDLVRTALQSGKHVLVEKPLATSVYGAESLVNSAASSGRVLMVGHTFLYNGAVRCLRQLVTGGELGDLYYMYSQRLNLGQVRDDVNAWWNLAPHDVSILLFLRGGVLPSSVTASGMSWIQEGIEDVVFATLTWDDGVIAHVHVSWLDPGKVRRTTLVGSRKMAIYDDLAAEKVEVWDKGIDRVPHVGERMDFNTQGVPTFSHRSGERFVPAFDFEEPLKVEIGHFLDCVLGDKEPLTGPRHAADVVAVIQAVDMAMKQGRTVQIAEVIER